MAGTQAVDGKCLVRVSVPASFTVEDFSALNLDGVVIVAAHTWDWGVVVSPVAEVYDKYILPEVDEEGNEMVAVSLKCTEITGGQVLPEGGVLPS